MSTGPLRNLLRTSFHQRLSKRALHLQAAQPNLPQSSTSSGVFKKLLFATPVIGLAYYISTQSPAMAKVSAQTIFETKPHALDEKNFVKFTVKKIEELSDNVKQ